MEVDSPTPNLFVIVLVIVLTLFGCNANAQTQRCAASNCPQASGELLKNVPYAAARFPVRDLNEDELKMLSYAGTGEAITEVWLPELETIEALETTLVETLQTMSRYEAPEILAAINLYRRQYIGVVINGEKLMIANLDRCSEFAEGQLEAHFIPVLPMDGGSCFLELVYNPESKTFIRFYIHGEA
jgi:hypothetical protein